MAPRADHHASRSTTSRPHPSTSSDDRSLGKTLHFMQQLWSLTHALQRMSKRMQSTLGVTGPQRLTLRMVGRSPGISAGRVSDALRLHPSTLTGILRRLEDRSLVRRKPDPSDGRRALFELTPAGRKLDELRSHTVESAVRRALLQCTPVELDATARVLEVLIAELEREAAST